MFPLLGFIEEFSPQSFLSLTAIIRCCFCVVLCLCCVLHRLRAGCFFVGAGFLVLNPFVSKFVKNNIIV
jgi:hypothetical protein